VVVVHAATFRNNATLLPGDGAGNLGPATRFAVGGAPDHVVRP
jgi:hypothetical protein